MRITNVFDDAVMARNLLEICNFILTSRVLLPSPVLIFLVTEEICLLILLRVTLSTVYRFRYTFQIEDYYFLFFCSPFRNESSFAFEFNQSFDKLNCVFDPRVFFVFQAQQDISSIKNIAGETGKKLSSLASTLMTDLQDRIL